jgi:hypothetical protein
MSQLDRKNLTDLLLLGLVLTGCEATEARSAGERTHTTRAAEQSQPQPNGPPGGLRATVAFGDREVPGCLSGDEMTLTIREADRILFTHDYCSAYGFGVAQMVTDSRGKHFVLLKHGEGHGNRVTNMYLTVYEFDRSLDERARLLIEEPAGIGADSTYNYRVDTPRGGGIVISGSWILDSDMLSAREARFAPERSRQILEIDTGPTAQR